HRQGLSLCRETVLFLDRFVNDELDLWLGDSVPCDQWFSLLSIPEISERALRVVDSRLAAFRNDSNAQIEECERCGRQAMVRPHRKSGCSCLYCGYIPVRRDQEDA